VWDINSGKVIDIIKFKEKNLFQEMILSGDGTTAVLSVSSMSDTYPENTTLPLYAYNTINKQHKVLTMKNTVLSLYNAQVSDDGKYLVCIVAYTTPYLWDLETGEVKYKLLKPDSYDSSMTAAISTNSNVVVTGVGQGGIDVWNINTGAILRTIKCDVVSNVYLSADGEVIFARDSKSNTINTWDMHTGSKLATVTTDGYPNQVHIVGDRLVVAVGENPNLIVMKLHIPGKAEKSKDVTLSPFDGLPLDVQFKDLSEAITEEDPMDNDKYDKGRVM
jgi:WD40 repeat protein